MLPFNFPYFFSLSGEFPPKCSQSHLQPEKKTLLDCFQMSCQLVFSREQSYKLLSFCAFCSFKNHKPVLEDRISPSTLSLGPRAGQGWGGVGWGLVTSLQAQGHKTLRISHLSSGSWTGHSVQGKFRNHTHLPGDYVLNSAEMWCASYTVCDEQ